METSGPTVPPAELDAFEEVDGVGTFRPAGTFHFRQAVSLVKQGIAEARSRGLHRLLVVTTRMKGFDPPAVAARLGMVREWVEAADGQVAVAIVARREFMDPERIGVVTANALGATANSFESEHEALAWLREQ